MLFLPELRGRLGDSDYVAFDTSGSPLQVEPRPDFGLATVLVSSPTDALKRISGDGMIIESLDRDATYRIEGFVLNRVILDKIGDATLSPEQLYDRIFELGHVWNVAAAWRPDQHARPGQGTSEDQAEPLRPLSAQ